MQDICRHGTFQGVGRWTARILACRAKSEAAAERPSGIMESSVYSRVLASSEENGEMWILRCIRSRYQVPVLMSRSCDGDGLLRCVVLALSEDVITAPNVC